MTLNSHICSRSFTHEDKACTKPRHTEPPDWVEDYVDGRCGCGSRLGWCYGLMFRVTVCLSTGYETSRCPKAPQVEPKESPS